MEKNKVKEVFKPEYFQDPDLTIKVLNNLYKNAECITVFDMYDSGDYMFMEVHDTAEVRNELSQIIADIDRYKSLNLEKYIGEESEIGLSLLAESFKKDHPALDLTWWADRECFESYNELDIDPAFH
jgi:hypothetical protein